MRLARIRTAVDRTLEGLLALLLGGMVLNVLWQVFARFALRDPSSVTEELARFALVWLGLLGASYAFGRRLHLAIALLPSRLRGARRRALDLAIQLAVIVFAAAVLLLGGGELVHLTLALDQTSAALGVRLGIVYLALPLSGAIVVFYAAAEIARTLAGGGES